MATLADNDDDNEVSTEEGVELPVEETTEEAEPVAVVEDERLAADDADEQPQRHKETAKERRDRAKAAKERDKRELAFQRNIIQQQNERLAALEQGQVVTRVTDLDNRLATALNEVDTFDKIFGKAIEAKNGDDARQARKLGDEAKQRAQAAYNEKQAILQQRQQQPAVDPRVERLAKDFMDANPWYNHTSNDEDSLIVKALDSAVASRYQPTDPAYWQALQERVKERLPQHFQEDAEDDAPRKGPPVGGSSRTNSPTSKSEIRLPAEYVTALKDAGLWDDPKTRIRMAKRYATQIKDSANR